MASSRRSPLLLILLGAVLAAALAALTLSGLLTPASGEKTERRSPSPAVAQADVQAALDTATGALLARDRAAWKAALPASGDASAAVTALYNHLARLPWTELRLVAEPARGRPGRFFVGAVGELGHAEPADRVFARRRGW